MPVKRLLACIARCLVFALVLTGVLRFAGRVLGGAEDPVNHSGEGLYAQWPGSVDVVFVGPSHVYNALIPQLIYDETGITSYDFASSAQSFEASSWAAVEAMRTARPDVVFVETALISADEAYRQTTNYYTSLARMLSPFSPTKYQAFADLRRIERESYETATQSDETSAGDVDWTDFFRVTAFHTQYASLTRTGLDFALGCDLYVSTHGFDASYRVASEEDIASQIETFPEEQLASAHLSDEKTAALDRIMDASEQYGVEVVFMVLPYFENARDTKLLDEAQAYVEERGFAFLDFNEMDLGLAAGADFSNATHTNYYGAVKTTRAMAAYLEEHFDLPDRRGTWLCRAWDASAGNYAAREAAEARLPGVSTQAQFREIAGELGDEFILAAAVQGSVSDEAAALLEERGMSGPASVWDEGRVQTGTDVTAYARGSSLRAFVREDRASLVFEGEALALPDRDGAYVAVFDTVRHTVRTAALYADGTFAWLDA